MEILQVKNLSFTYPESDKKILNDVSFSVKSGEFVVVCGESGCGKSTLLKIIKKELSPYGKKEGAILYGKELKEEFSGGIGIVMQNPDSQIVTDTVWHELAFGLENLGYPSDVIRRRVAEMAAYFGIDGWYNKKINELSGGQKQMLNLAAVMVMQPKILLLDEPTAQLDPIAAESFISTLHKINRELGLSVILVEHRLEDVLAVADRMILLEKGKLIYNQPPKKIMDYFKVNGEHPMFEALPAPVRIFYKLNGRGDAPLDVREARNFIFENYTNHITTLKHNKYIHSDIKSVELKDVWFRYEKKSDDVLKGISVSVYKGEHFCIMGGNGAGKTTILSVLAGLLKQYRGKISVEKGKIALLPQNPQTLFLEKTVREDLKEIGKSDEKIEEIAKRICIADVLDMHPYDLSGGEQQKAALAKLLLLEPDVLLLDEPTKGIDAFSKKTFSEIIKSLQKDGITVITVTHDVEFAAGNADRCGLLFNGEFVSCDVPIDFFSENHFYTTPANRISRGFYKNVITCEDVTALCNVNKGDKADVG